jgi:hypothetical protein
MSGRDLPVNGIAAEHNGSRLLKMIQTQHPNYHPAMSIAKLAHQEGLDEDLQFRCHSTLLKYVEPELRSVQIQAEVKETRIIRVSLFEALEGEKVVNPKLAEQMSKAPKLGAVMDVVGERVQSGEDDGQT